LPESIKLISNNIKTAAGDVINIDKNKKLVMFNEEPVKSFPTEARLR
jgi:hypothetical protein